MHLNISRPLNFVKLIKLTMSRDISHLLVWTRDEPEIKTPKPYANFEIEMALKELARIAHITASVALASRHAALREVDEKIQIHLDILAENPRDQAAWLRELIVACFPQQQTADVGAHTDDDGWDASHTHTPASTNTDSPSTAEEDAEFALHLDRVAAERNVNFAQLHIETLGQSTVDLSIDLVWKMRAYGVNSLQQVMHRRAELISEIAKLHDGFRPWHYGVCGSPDECGLCGPLFVMGSEEGEEGVELDGVEEED